MFEKVLVGVDSPVAGRDAVALANVLVGHDGAMTLMHVLLGLPVPPYSTSPELADRDRERAERMLELLRGDASVEAASEVVQGPSPGQVLHVQAEARGCDLIVVGSSHRGLLGRVMLGDDTRAALNGAPCAVAIAPAGFADRSGELATIGVAYDGSAESEAALNAAVELASARHAKVRALRIVPPPSRWYTGLVPPVLLDLDGVVERADAEMRKLEGVEGRAELGLPGEDLASFSREVGLLVAGSRAYGPLRRLVQGSTSNYLQRHARSALLVLPRGANALPAIEPAGG
jgi:nucleotide-binding universal stress UspA family protein